MRTLFRFFLGGGWWTAWYLFYFLVVWFGNGVWFNELLEMCRKGEKGPGSGTAGLGLMAMGGFPMLIFTIVHLVLAFRWMPDSRARLVWLSLVLLALLFYWMIAGSAGIAEATMRGFVHYYVLLGCMILANLTLLWLARNHLSLASVWPF